MSSSSKSPGPIQKHIEAKLRDTLEPAHLEIINDSYKHNVPKGKFLFLKTNKLIDLNVFVKKIKNNSKKIIEISNYLHNRL